MAMKTAQPGPTARMVGGLFSFARSHESYDAMQNSWQASCLSNRGCLGRTEELCTTRISLFNCLSALSLWWAGIVVRRPKRNHLFCQSPGMYSPK